MVSTPIAERPTVDERSCELVVEFPSREPLTDHLLELFGRLLPGRKVGRGRRGELIISAVKDNIGTRANVEVFGQMWFFQKQHDGGEATGCGQGWATEDPDPDSGSDLPVVRDPDAAWLTPGQVAALNASRPPDGIRREYPRIVPAFVVEVRSRSQSVEDQVGKVCEWVAAGAEVGWMVDPFERTVHVVRPGPLIERHDDPGMLPVGPEVPGLEIDFDAVWRAASG